jgi:hypothetical protein
MSAERRTSHDANSQEESPLRIKPSPLRVPILPQGNARTWVLLLAGRDVTAVSRSWALEQEEGEIEDSNKT